MIRITHYDNSLELDILQYIFFLKLHIARLFNLTRIYHGTILFFVSRILNFTLRGDTPQKKNDYPPTKVKYL